MRAAWLRALRDQAPQRGATIGGVPEVYGFILALAFGAGLLAVALLIR